jgi:DNA-binding LacI/PurR family transcriptional regulator
VGSNANQAKHNNRANGRPTLERVAARAGVSRTTVSRVVNGWPTVAAHLRESVQRAVDDLGYVPNLAARSLVTQKTEAIALVLSGPPDRIFSDEPFFSGIIRGVSQELEANFKHLILIQPASTTAEDKVERYIAAGHVDGVIAVSTEARSGLRNRLADDGVPVVCSGRTATRPLLSYVDVDNVGGAASAVEHLLARGCRRIATITGPRDTVAGLDRLTGYREALRGVHRRSIVATGDFGRDTGEQAMHRLLDFEPDLDGVFCASDMMAIGALRALRAAGRRVPDDVAVVGFDDINAARYTEPALTTVRQPVEDIGREMVRLVLRIAADEDVDKPVVLPTDLVVRESA